MCVHFVRLSLALACTSRSVIAIMHALTCLCTLPLILGHEARHQEGMGMDETKIGKYEPCRRPRYWLGYQTHPPSYPLPISSSFCIVPGWASVWVHYVHQAVRRRTSLWRPTHARRRQNVTHYPMVLTKQSNCMAQGDSRSFYLVRTIVLYSLMNWCTSTTMYYHQSTTVLPP